MPPERPLCLRDVTGWLAVFGTAAIIEALRRLVRR